MEENRMAILIIAEKPRVAAKLSEALGYARINSLHGVKYYEINLQGKSIYIAPAVGHLFTLDEKRKSREYPTFDIEWKPSYLVSKTAKFTEKYFLTLKELCEKAEEIINASDYDIEGSTIGGNIITFLGKGKKARRMAFSTVTAEDLRKAFENASELDILNIDAGIVRHVLDWMWGINCSRALMHSLQKVGMYKTLSIGRVQGPLLYVLTEREKKILSFKPERFWYLVAIAKDTKFFHEKGNIFSKEEAEKIYRNCRENIADARIANIEKKKVGVLPLFPFDATTMQVEAYRVFGFTPSRTLEIAQSLYESGYCSYPRTSSQKLPLQLNLSKIIERIKANPQYFNLASELIEKKRFKPREGIKEDPAHPAIFPTGIAPKDSSEEEKKLYDLIVKRFLSCFAETAIRERQRITLAIRDEIFSVNGAITLEKGWMKFYEPYTALEDVELPEFFENEKVSIQKLELIEDETKPPRRYSPASIIKKLESLGIGTKATRAEILETLYKRNYLEGRRQIKVTPFGMAIENALEKNVKEILSEKLTREFEDKMELVQQGKEKKEKVIEEGKSTLREILLEFKSKEGIIGKELLEGLKLHERKESMLGKCNKCNEGFIEIKRYKNGKFAACNKYPDCKNAFPLPREGKIMASNKLCNYCNTPIIKVKRAKKKPFEMCLFPGCESKKNWNSYKNKSQEDGNRAKK